MDPSQARAHMVERHLAARGLTDPRLLSAFVDVAREEFLPATLTEFAYEDTALPIAAGQTISQPYIVALTVDALKLEGHERVLEVGTGSGYAAAVLSRMAREVYTIERVAALAKEARERLKRLGYDNVHVLHGDGTLGCSEHAPFDAIAVAAGGPDIPQSLLSQLTMGGRLVIPFGPNESGQVLTRVTREGADKYHHEPLADVRFVPLIGAQGWPQEERLLRAPAKSTRRPAVAKLIREVAEPIDRIDSCSLDALLERIGDARLVLIGESTHGTSEFYRMRARITKELITKRGFDFVAAEADWPDAARIDDHVLARSPRSPIPAVAFERFPRWLWRNAEVLAFVSWLRSHNQTAYRTERQVGFHGLDLYSLFTSIAVVLAYLDEVDPEAARVARLRYGTLTPWQKDPAAYGRAVLVGRYQSSEAQVVAMLRDMLAQRLAYVEKDGELFFDAAQNARVVSNPEHYYRAMYYGSVQSWNLRDRHMFDTLKALSRFYGESARGIVWAHNSHLGDARATDMGARGELNLGQLCREELGDAVYAIGLGTDHGTVAAASNWDEPMETMNVRPSVIDSYERIMHESALPAFCLPLRTPRRPAVRDELRAPRLERAIGVIYRPDTELASHCFYATLPHQFDEWIWFDETRSVTALPQLRSAQGDLPDTYPSGL